MLCSENITGYHIESPFYYSYPPVIRRLSRFLLYIAFIVMTAGHSFAFAADDIQIKTARIEYSDNTYRLLTSYSLDFNHSLEEMLSHGIPLYFKTEIEIVRPRAFWFNEVPRLEIQNNPHHIQCTDSPVQYFHSGNHPAQLQHTGGRAFRYPLSTKLGHSGAIRSFSRRGISGRRPDHAGYFTIAKTIPDQRSEQP